MALPSWLMVSVGGRRSKRSRPSPTLKPLVLFHQWRHNTLMSLWGPFCAHCVGGTTHGEVCDIFFLKRSSNFLAFTMSFATTQMVFSHGIFVILLNTPFIFVCNSYTWGCILFCIPNDLLFACHWLQSVFSKWFW